MDGESRRQAVFRQVLAEVGRVGTPVGRPQALHFGGIAGGIGERTGRLRLATENMHLDEIQLRDRIAHARFLQPAFPRLEYTRDFPIGIHPSRVG